MNKKKLTHREIYEMMDKKEVLREALKALVGVQEEVLKEPISIKNQMIMVGIAYSLSDERAKYNGNFELDYKEVLEKLEKNHEEFYIKNKVFMEG